MFFRQTSTGLSVQKPLLLSVLFVFFSGATKAQSTENFDEAKAGSYTLPQLLVTEAGKKIRTAEEWETLQRPVLLRLFETHLYGKIGGRPKAMHYRVKAVDPAALQGKATRKEVTLYFTKGEDGPSLHVLLYLPNAARGKAPVFTGLNFLGNHTVQKDTGITITAQWKALHPGVLHPDRGTREGRWPVETLIDAGYGLATAWYEELEPDKPEGWQRGIRTTLQQDLDIRPDEWGAISAWAWGLSRIMDYLATDDRVDAEKVIVTGHSRLGKAALWAGANDRRFAAVVSNNSGEGGAALSRRNFGETVYRINTSFPHWFVDRYKTYNHQVEKLPVDQHMLLALQAPRPLYVASATEDTWADPKGEFLSAREAGGVYALYGLKGIDAETAPPANTPVGDAVRYHIRTGKHDITLYDWQQYIGFANRFFRKKSQ
ncbi:MAG TPA: hypothetical protein VGN63_13050 [Flavisolibacter sp.]|jgi:hypothetical protein|nr:hypothetical protein [Flavisolibacter sp.]